jgi:UDP-N-acetylglucosamine 2-epimerase (hydrolysing)
MSRNILFLTGTRADFGKIKALIRCVDGSPSFESSLFVTGMHTLSRYGYTVDEVYKSLDDHRLSQGFRSVYTFMNQVHGESMELILANTINGLSPYVHEFAPDMIVVHGDRVEALAGAIVGALCNIRVAHIEGGEISGTIDELIRHAVTKMAHIHFVANDEAASRLKQLGESDKSVFVIGSPDIDLMLSPDLPAIEEVRSHYGISFDEYGIVLFHPVTTDLAGTAAAADALVSALLASSHNYVVIHPNNDKGCDLVFSAYDRLKDNARFIQFPSMRIEYFLALLKSGQFIIGNSSAGIREAPVYGVYSINIAGRQRNRFSHESIIDVDGSEDSIRGAIESISQRPQCEPSYHFGRGDSASLFLSALEDPALWNVPRQKQFVDMTHESGPLEAVNGDE